MPDSTPGIIARYSFNDEQAVLARVRYNRLIDIFLGIACLSLQNHFRTTVPGMGQVETDEIYVGVDKGGSHYVVPVQAKGGAWFRCSTNRLLSSHYVVPVQAKGGE